MRTVSLFVTLLVFWLLLSGQWDYRDPSQQYLLIVGVACCGFVAWLLQRVNILDRETHPNQMLVQILLYIPWLLKTVVLANVHVAKLVLRPSKLIHPQWLTIRHSLKSPVAQAIYANSITLAPGTVVVALDEKHKALMIHALSETAANRLLTQTMHDEVAKIEVSEL